MKFRYYIRGFGAGLIVATAVLLIAGMIEKNNNCLLYTSPSPRDA